MRPTTIHRRMPRAGLDPIDEPAAALATFSLVMHRPRRHETILLLLDDTRCGRSILTVTGTTDPDSSIEIVEFVTGACERLGALVIASVRPGDHDHDDHDHDHHDHDHDLHDHDHDHDDHDGGDVDRWLEMSEIASLAGVELVEWFVIGRDVSCPRDRLGESPRW